MSVLQITGGVASLCIAFILWRLFFWFREGRRMRTPGYLPPPPSWFGRTAFYLSARFAHWLAIGPIKVIGRENAPRHGRVLILPNHQHGIDFAAVRLSLPYSYRQIGALKEVTRVPGLAALSAFSGTFAVPVEGGKSTAGTKGGANPAIEAVATVLASAKDARQLVFPQGKLVYTNELKPEDFRTGATRALQIAAAKIGDDEMYVLPIAVHYTSTRARIGFFRRQIDKIWRKFFKGYGVPMYATTVVVCKPIAHKSLPADPRAAIELIRQRIQEGLDTAIANS